MNILVGCSFYHCLIMVFGLFVFRMGITSMVIMKKRLRYIISLCNVIGSFKGFECY